MNYMNRRVFNYDSLHSNVETSCTETAIVDICRDKDNYIYDVFTHSDIIDNTQMLCIR